MMESEPRVSRCDRSLAPCDGLRVNVDPVVAAVQIITKSDGQISDAGPDVEHAMFRPKASRDQLLTGIPARCRERIEVERPVVVDAEVRRREQRVVASLQQPIEGCDRAM